MSAEIDKRVVEMQFDNKQFERNVQTSLNTLDKLKMALNFDGAKGLDSITQAAKKMNLSNITSQTEKVQVSFSALQVAGMTMVSELTKSFMNLGKNLWNMSFGQIKSGGMGRALKIEQADFKMKALVDKMDQFKDDAAGAAAYIKDMGDAIDWAVTGTAYGYDSAASVAAQLMASGHDNVEQMKKDLRAVAGAAAMTGRSYDDMGRIFAAVAGQGKMMGDQLLQFSAGGINAAATIADYLGKSEKEVREMVSKGMVDFQTFSDAMYDAYGEAAGKADETYAGVLSNVKAQLSRLGQRFAQPYIKNMIPFLQQLKATIKEISRVLTPVAERFDQIFGALTNWGRRVLKSFNATKMSIGFRSLENVLWGIAGILHTVHDAFVEVFPPKTTEQVITLAQSIESFTEEILPTKEALDGLRGILVSILTPFRVVSKLFGVATKYARPLIAAVLKIGYAVTSIFRVLEPIATWLLDRLLGGVDILDTVLNVVTTAVMYLSAALQVLIMLLSDVMLEIIESDRFKGIAQRIREIADKIKNALITGLVMLLDLISEIVTGISNADEGTSWFSRMANNAKQLWEVMKQLAGAFIEWFNTADSMKGISAITGFLKDLFGLITNFFAGNDISGNVNGMSESLKKLGDAFLEMKNKFKAAWDDIDKGTIMMVLFGVSILFLISSIKHLVDNTSQFVSAMTDLPKIMTDIRRAIQNIGNFAGPAQTLLAFAAAVSSLTAAIVTLSKLPREDMIASAIAIGSISAVLMAFVLAIDIFAKRADKNEKKINDTVINMIALTASIVALSMSLKTIASLQMNVGDMVKAIGSIIILMASLVGTVYLLNKISPELKGSIITIVGFSLSVMIIVKSFEMLAGIDIEQLTEKIAAFGSLILLFGAAVGLAGSASGWASLAITSFTGSVIVLFGLFMLLTTIPMDLIMNAIKLGTQVFNMFIPLIISVGVASKMAGKGTKLGGTIWLLVMSMTTFLITFMIFVRMVAKIGDSDVIERSMEMVKSIMTYMGVFVVVVMGIDAAMALATRKDKHALANSMRANNSFKNLATMIISLAASVLLIALAAKSLSNTDPKAMVAIGVYILEIMGLVTIVNLFSKKAVAGGMKVGPIVAMLSALGIVLAALIAFQFADPDKLLISSVAILAALSGIAILFGGMSLIMQTFDRKGKKSEKSSNEAVSVLLSLLGFVAAVTGLMIVVNKMETDKIISSMTGLIVMLGVIAVIVAYFAGVPTANYNNAKQGIIAMYSILPIVLALCYAMYKLAGINDNGIKQAGKAMIVIAGTLMGLLLVVVLLSKIPKLNTNKVIKLSLSMVAMSAAIAVIAVAAAVIADIEATKIETAMRMILAISAMLIVVTGVMAVIAAIPSINWTIIAAMAGGMIALASSIALISSAFATLKSSGANPEEIKAYAITLGLMVAALTAVGAVIGFFGTPAIAGIIGIATAFLEFGIAAKVIAEACVLVAHAIKLLGSTTAEEVDNMVDSCIRFMGRIGDIVDAFKESYPKFIEGIQLLFRGIGTAIGVTIGEIFGSVIVIGSAAIVDNIDILLAAVYLALRALVDWLNSDEVLNLVSDAFTALVNVAIAAIDGLTHKILNLRGSLKELMGDLEGYSFAAAWEQFVKDENKENWIFAYKAGIDALAKYSGKKYSEMTEEEKVAYDNLVKHMNDLMESGKQNHYSAVEHNKLMFANDASAQAYADSFEGIYKALGTDVEDFYERSKELGYDISGNLQDVNDRINNLDANAQTFSRTSVFGQIIDESYSLEERIEAVDKELFNSGKSHEELLKENRDAYLKYVEETQKNSPDTPLMSEDEYLEQRMAEAEAYKNQLDEMIEKQQSFQTLLDPSRWITPGGVSTTPIMGDTLQIAGETLNTIEEGSQTANNVSNWLNILGHSLDIFNNNSRDVINTSNELNNSIHGIGKTIKEEVIELTPATGMGVPFEKVEESAEQAKETTINIFDDIKESLANNRKEVESTFENAMGGYDRLSYSINKSPIRPKFDGAGLKLLNDNLNVIDNNFKKVSKIGDTLQLKDDIDPTVNATDDLGTEVEETSSAIDAAKQPVDALANSIANLSGVMKENGWDLSKYSDQFWDFIGKKPMFSDMAAEYKESSEDMFETAAEARAYAMEMVNYQSAVGMVKIPRWQTYVNDGKRIYTDVEDFVNKHTSTGKNWFERMFGLEGGKTGEMVAKAKEGFNDVLNNVSNGLTSVGDSASDAADETDKLGESIKSTLDVFTEFNDEAKTSSRAIFKSFESQIDGIKKWQGELEELATRGMNQNFLKELADEGPAAYDKIHAFYTMSSNELALFNHMYAEKLVLQDDTANHIRQSFVDAGIMFQDEADAMARSIGDRYDAAVLKAQAEAASKKNGQMTAATKKRLAQMYAEIEKYQADTEFIEKWYDSNAVIGETAGEAIATNAEETLNKTVIGTAAYKEAGKEMVELIGEGITSASPDIIKGMEDLGKASMESLKASLEFEKVLEPINKFRSSVYEQVEGSLKLFDEVKQKTAKEEKESQISATQMLYNMAENTKKIGRWATNLKTLAAKGMSEGLLEELRKLGPEGADKVDAFVRMTSDQLKKANSFYNSSTNLAGYVSDKLTSTYAEQGFAMSLGLKKGINEGKGDILAQMYEIGTESSEGFKNGIDPDAAKQAMELLGGNTLAKLCQVLDINSPSRETYAIGVNTVLGLKNGIEDPEAVGELMNSIAEFGLKIKQAYKETADEKYIDRPDILSDDAYEPVIRPLVDMSGVESGIASFFANRQFSLSGTIGNAMAAQNKGPSVDAIMITTAVKELGSRVDRLNNSVNELRQGQAETRNAIRGIDIRLDTGALVGGIVNQMDSALGSKAVRVKRRKG